MDNNEKVSIDWGGVRGAQWMGASGIIGLLANAALQPGGLLNRFGAGGPPPVGPMAPVSREILDLKSENTMLKANAHTDALNTAQVAINATQAAQLGSLQRQLDELRSMTRLVIPNGNLNPGVGPVAVVPVPPPAAPTTPDTATINAIVQAVLAAQKDVAAAG